MAHIQGEILKRLQKRCSTSSPTSGHEPRFNPHMLRASKVSDGPIREGTRFRAEIGNAERDGRAIGRAGDRIRAVADREGVQRARNTIASCGG